MSMKHRVRIVTSVQRCVDSFQGGENAAAPKRWWLLQFAAKTQSVSDRRELSTFFFFLKS